MNNTVWALLVAFGVTAFLVDSALLSWARRRLPGWIRRHASCYQCAGAWVGLGVGLLDELRGLELVAFAFVSSGVAHVVGSWARSQVIFPPVLAGDETDGA